jgi:hypothetical protein
MPNAIKYNTSAETLALKKGNFWIGTGDVGKGPTSSTGYYNGITPPSGGYTIYLNKSSGGPSIYTVNTEAQLTGLTNTISYITTNYISNGGNFADGTSSPFNGVYNNAGGVSRVVSIANDRPYAGSTSTNALELNGKGGRVIDTNGLLTVGQTYTFSFWAKRTSGSSFTISWNNQNGSGETNSWSQGNINITTSWQRYSQVFTYNAARTQFYFYNHNQLEDNVAVFTEFQLSLGSSPCGPGITTTSESINWFLTQTDKMIFNLDYPAIITNGLVMNLDVGFAPSITSLPTNIFGNSYGSYIPTWYDVSSGGNNGTLNNGPTYNSANGGSIVFDGVDDYVSIPFNSNLVTTTVTVNMWCYATTLNVYRTPFTSEPGLNAGVNGYGFRQRLDNTWWWVIGYEGNGAVASTSLTQNVWVNLTGTYDGTTLTLYKNGSSVSTAAGGGRTVNFTSPSINGNIRVGSLTSGNDFFSGNVAIVQIYNRALSATEVFQNYNAQKGRFGL